MTRVNIDILGISELKWIKMVKFNSEDHYIYYWGQEEKGTTEDEMAGWHHWLDGHESEWTPGVGDGQGGQACCDSWGCKELDTTEQLNWTEYLVQSSNYNLVLLSFLMW